MSNITKTDLIALIEEGANITKVQAEKALSTYLETVKKELAEGNTIQCVGFGTFSVSERKARKGRNPQTGEALDIPASKFVKFSAGKDLKEAINKK